MTSDTTTVHASTPAAKIRRMLAVLAIAFSLVAISAFGPEDAGAKRMTEHGASQLCTNNGGIVDYEFYDSTLTTYDMRCHLPKGRIMVCFSSPVWHNTVDCSV